MKMIIIIIVIILITIKLEDFDRDNILIDTIIHTIILWFMTFDIKL